MASYANISAKCIALSQKVMSLGVGINARKGAQVLFYQLCESVTELGAGLSAIDYMPARSMRSQQSVEMIKCSQKVIFMLNLALSKEVFLKKPTAEALNLAVSVANDVNALVQVYTGAPVPAVAVQMPAEAPAEEAAAEGEKAAPSDPDGFNAPYDGTL